MNSTSLTLAFPAIPHLELAPVPYDLENEPYTSTDTGVRPDFQSERPYFNYTITDNSGVSIRVGHSVWNWHESVPDRSVLLLPSKRCCVVSAVDVYGKYGLAITQAYLRRAYEHELACSHPWWFSVYCVASLFLVDRRRAGSLLDKMISTPACHQLQVGLLACSALLSHFSVQDKLDKDKWPTMLASSQVRAELLTSPHFVPSLNPEVLALICNSKRISRGISAHVLVQRQTRQLREGELEHRALTCAFLCTSGVTCSQVRNEKQKRLVLENKEGRFHLYSIEDLTRCTPTRTDVISYSPDDYSRILGKPERSAWSEMPQTSTELSDECLSAWVLLLLFRRGRQVLSQPAYLSRRELEELFTSLL